MFNRINIVLDLYLGVDKWLEDILHHSHLLLDEKQHSFTLWEANTRPEIICLLEKGGKHGGVSFLP